MFYDDEDEDIDIYEDDPEYEGDDEDDDEDEDEDDDEETLKELDVDENGHVVEGRRKRRRAGGYDDFEDTDPYGYYE
jgi:hypothetical protein